VPVNPTPIYNAEVVNSNLDVVDPEYFGFTVIKKRATRPAGVKQILQRSVNGGKTWKRMRTDADWLITETPTQIRVESKRLSDAFVPILPPGTEDHLYRVKVTLGN
jgi:hypothetical protein